MSPGSRRCIATSSHTTLLKHCRSAQCAARIRWPCSALLGREAAQVSRNRKKSKLEDLKMLTANARAEVAEKRERLRHLNRIPSRLVGFRHNIPPPYILQAPAYFLWQQTMMLQCGITGVCDGTYCMISVPAAAQLQRGQGSATSLSSYTQCADFCAAHGDGDERGADPAAHVHAANEARARPGRQRAAGICCLPKMAACPTYMWHDRDRLTAAAAAAAASTPGMPRQLLTKPCKGHGGRLTAVSRR